MGAEQALEDVLSSTNCVLVSAAVRLSVEDRKASQGLQRAGSASRCYHLVDLVCGSNVSMFPEPNLDLQLELLG
jgi:hypothetical protein